MKFFLKLIILLLLCSCVQAQNRDELYKFNPEWKCVPLASYTPYDFEESVHVAFSPRSMNFGMHIQREVLKRWYDDEGHIYSANLANDGTDNIVDYQRLSFMEDKNVFDKIKDHDSVFWFAFTPYEIWNRKYYGVVENGKISFYDKEGAFYENLDSLAVKVWGSIPKFEQGYIESVRHYMKHSKSGYCKIKDVHQALNFLNDNYLYQIFAESRSDNKQIVKMIVPLLQSFELFTNDELALISDKLHKQLCINTNEKNSELIIQTELCSIVESVINDEYRINEFATELDYHHRQTMWSVREVVRNVVRSQADDNKVVVYYGLFSVEQGAKEIGRLQKQFVKTFYTEYMNNILEGRGASAKAKYDELLGNLTPALQDKIAQLIETTGADPIICAQDVIPSMIETLMVESQQDGWQLVSYTVSYADVASRTEIPVKVDFVDGKLCITDIEVKME